MMVDIGQTSLDIIPLLDMTIALWSLYAFFMVMGLSEDVIGKVLSNLSRETAKAFLGLNFILLIFLSFLAFYSGFPTRLPLALGLIFLLLFYKAIKRLRKRRKSLLKFNLKKTIMSNIQGLLMMSFILCVVLVIFVRDEQQVIPYFIVGLLALLIHIVIKEEVKID